MNKKPDWTGYTQIRGKDWRENLKMNSKLNQTGCVQVNGQDWQGSLKMNREQNEWQVKGRLGRESQLG